MQISFDRKTITNCLQQNFVLPTFQRDYKWELKHLQDLMSIFKIHSLIIGNQSTDEEQF